MKHKTAELEGAALDAAVALAEGILVTKADEHPEQPGYYKKTRKEWGEHIVRWFGSNGEEGGWEAISSWGSPSTEWTDGGLIKAREKINTVYDWKDGLVGAFKGLDMLKADVFTGETELVAAMRCYVASKLGEEVELP